MEKKEFIINYPSVYMHTAPNPLSEACDELLYGTAVKKIGETGEYFRCETSYGYSGYLHKRYVSEKTPRLNASPFVVVALCCDILTEPAYKYRPVMTLPRGSIIYSRHLLARAGKFLPAIHKKHKCYVPCASLRPLVSPSTIPKEPLSVFRKSLCDDALSYLGTPYRWGGKSSFGIDCSGLCFMTYFLNGLPLWRDSYADKRYVHEISAEKVKPGDLIYFKGHMAIYIGDGEYVHSSASAGCVTVNSLHKNSIIYRADLADSFICFARSNLL